MKHIRILGTSILIIISNLLVPFTVLAIEGSAGGKQQQPGVTSTLPPPSESIKPAAEPQSDLPVYKPPRRGEPAGRLAGGSRGGREGSVNVYVLAPDHVGYTTREQPSLYWFLSVSTRYPIEFTIIESQAVRPLVESRINQNLQPGLQRIQLADYGVRLKTGVHYQWFIAIISDPDQRSKDVIAGGDIERVDLEGGVRAKLDTEGKRRAPHIYAEAGIWYDALSSVFELIASEPSETVFRKQRTALLQQIGLSQVADEMKP